MSNLDYSIKVYKQYFNFASSHFLIFENGTREPLHGHNYRVQVEAKSPLLKDDMVFDFLNIKPIVRRVCDSLDHRLLLPQENAYLTIEIKDDMAFLHIRGKNEFVIPTQDILILPIPNTSAERLAIYLAQQIEKELMHDFGVRFQELIVEVEETPGQSAVYRHLH